MPAARHTYLGHLNMDTISLSLSRASLIKIPRTESIIHACPKCHHRGFKVQRTNREGGGGGGELDGRTAVKGDYDHS